MKVKQLIMCKGSLEINLCVTMILNITKAYFYSNCKRKHSKVRKLRVCVLAHSVHEVRMAPFGTEKYATM